ncbi:hypothetical protein BS47DRAFT_1365691 [Hydnum rufescens UP504]|uniref:Uncharacterized protein n=1 Tax=Hydnum rufescens UP504 TaxID=1448309 RepID=A0A9P6AMX9_9AGAM|nr:hypothetical protein BS47DRAFT_1365691 [Hydnum rufescens UP504]
MGMSFVIVKVWISETNRDEDQKTKAHVEKAVKHQAPGIDVTLNKYNALRKDMLRERGKNGVKRDAYDIWQNADMADFEGGKVPLWLSDTEVWDGIRAAQEVKSCREELFRFFEFSKDLGTGLTGDSCPAGVADWKDILEPPPIHCAWACRQGQQENRSRVSIDDGDASSDDEDNVELEPAGETDDADLGPVTSWIRLRVGGMNMYDIVKINASNFN